MGGWLNTSCIVVSIRAIASVRYREVVRSWEGGSTVYTHAYLYMYTYVCTCKSDKCTCTVHIMYVYTCIYVHVLCTCTYNTLHIYMYRGSSPGGGVGVLLLR